METAVKKLYEGMFLVDPTSLSDWDALVKTIKKLLDRSEAEIVSIRNWAEKKLAYEINHKSRGTYVLCYFKADAEKIKNIEKDVQLSEQVIRVLILGTETRDKRDVEKDILGPQSESEEPKAAVEKVSTQQKPQQASEPEQSDAPFVVDTSEPEQSDAPVVVDTSEPEEPIEPAVVDVTEPEKPVEPAVADVIELEKPAESTSEDKIEPEQPATPEASDTSEPEQPETDQEPKEPEKKKFFGW